MMGHQSKQMAMIFVDMESLILENQLLRKVEQIVSFDFIHYIFWCRIIRQQAVYLLTLTVCLNCS